MLLFCYINFYLCFLNVFFYRPVFYEDVGLLWWFRTEDYTDINDSWEKVRNLVCLHCLSWQTISYMLLNNVSPHQKKTGGETGWI